MICCFLGLFHRSISLSGNALSPYIQPTADPLSLAHRHASELGIETNTSSADLVAALRAIPAHRLIDTTDRLKFLGVDPLMVYGLVVERNTHSDDGAYLTDAPSRISQSGQYVHVPWMQGFVQNEGAFRAAAIAHNATLLAELNRNIRELFAKFLMIGSDGRGEMNRVAKDDVVKRIFQRYLNGSTAVTAKNTKGFIDVRISSCRIPSTSLTTLCSIIILLLVRSDVFRPFFPVSDVQFCSRFCTDRPKYHDNTRLPDEIHIQRPVFIFKYIYEFNFRVWRHPSRRYDLHVSEQVYTRP